MKSSQIQYAIHTLSQYDSVRTQLRAPFERDSLRPLLHMLSRIVTTRQSEFYRPHICVAM